MQGDNRPLRPLDTLSNHEVPRVQPAAAVASLDTGRRSAGRPRSCGFLRGFSMAADRGPSDQRGAAGAAGGSPGAAVARVCASPARVSWQELALGIGSGARDRLPGLAGFAPGLATLAGSRKGLTL